MEVEAVILEPTEILKKKGILAFAEVVLIDESGEKIVLRGLKVYRHPITKRVKILYPKHSKLHYPFYSPLPPLMRKVNDAVLKKFTEILDIEDLARVLGHG